jgi:putative oxidoreductase
MERSVLTGKIETAVIIFSIILILFWFVAAGLKLYDFGEWKQEMYNQIFSRTYSNTLLYAVPAIEVITAGLITYSATRLAGIILSFFLILAFTIYVGLALLEVYSRSPCNCAGLLGQNSSWGANFILNLFVTGVALAGMILTIKSKTKKRRVKGLDATVSHVPLTA